MKVNYSIIMQDKSILKSKYKFETQHQIDNEDN